jgi:hypothetical protein
VSAAVDGSYWAVLFTVLFRVVVSRRVCEMLAAKNYNSVQ